MLLSAVSVLVVVQLSPEVQEGLMNYPVYTFKMLTKLYPLIKSFNKVHDATVQQHENKWDSWYTESYMLTNYVMNIVN